MKDDKMINECEEVILKLKKEILTKEVQLEQLLAKIEVKNS